MDVATDLEEEMSSDTSFRRNDGGGARGRGAGGADAAVERAEGLPETVGDCGRIRRPGVEGVERMSLIADLMTGRKVFFISSLVTISCCTVRSEDSIWAFVAVPSSVIGKLWRLMAEKIGRKAKLFSRAFISWMISSMSFSFLSGDRLLLGAFFDMEAKKRVFSSATAFAL